MADTAYQKIAFLLLAVTACFISCKKDFGNLNSSVESDYLNNASKEQLNNLVSGTESGIRIKLALYLDDVGTLGRETYRFSPSEPTYLTELLGFGETTLSSSSFYIVNPWATNYRIVKNCNLLEKASANSVSLSVGEKYGYSGFAKTIKAYQLLLTLNLTYSNGIRIDVENADKPGPVVAYEDALRAIDSLLRGGRDDLSKASVVFPLSGGFDGFNNATGLIKFNAALAARVAVYRMQWNDALTDLGISFFDLHGNFSTGIYSVFSTGTGDMLNPLFIPQNQNGEIRVAHPSYASGIETGDDRINKTSLRTTTASLNGLSSDRDVWVYTSSVAPAPVIRNEELILIYTEANIWQNNLADAVEALNIIRRGHHLADYAGVVDQPALITEMLQQRRYSLYFEGHRWIDIRRYNLLGTLPVDRTNDDVWPAFPLPLTEQ